MYTSFPKSALACSPKSIARVGATSIVSVTEGAGAARGSSNPRTGISMTQREADSQFEVTAMSLSPASKRDVNRPAREVERSRMRLSSPIDVSRPPQPPKLSETAKKRIIVLTRIFLPPYTIRAKGECIEKHFSILKQRYGEKKLKQAALRRAHLNYQRIHIGDNPGSGRVKFLLAQMHQNYYFGFSESACILAGTLLEQGLIYRLGGLMDTKGPLRFRKNGETKWLQTRHDLLDLELVDMLDLARAEGILREGRIILLAHELRWIRNMVVHDKIPLFAGRDARFLEMSVVKSRRGRVKYAKILLEKSEVAELSGSRAELTAYFCVSRARMILRSLFNTAETEAGKKNESSGDLFLWKES
jgi:hypothetical protein